MNERKNQALLDLALAMRDIRNCARTLKETLDTLGDASYVLDADGATIGPVESFLVKLEDLTYNLENLSDEIANLREKEKRQ